MMRILWTLAIVAVLSIGFGCGEEKEEPASGDKDTACSTDKDTASTVKSSGPEATARAMLEGFKKGDRGAFLNGIDLKGLYELLVAEENRGEVTYDDFVAKMREGMEQAPAPPEGFEYKIKGSRKDGDIVILTISVKEDADAEWDTNDVPFKKIDGTWKVTAEGFLKMMEE